MFSGETQYYDSEQHDPNRVFMLNYGHTEALLLKAGLLGRKADGVPESLSEVIRVPARLAEIRQYVNLLDVKSGKPKIAVTWEEVNKIFVLGIQSTLITKLQEQEADETPRGHFAQRIIRELPGVMLAEAGTNSTALSLTVEMLITMLESYYQKGKPIFVKNAFIKKYQDLNLQIKQAKDQQEFIELIKSGAHDESDIQLMDKYIDNMTNALSNIREVLVAKEDEINEILYG